MARTLDPRTIDSFVLPSEESVVVPSWPDGCPEPGIHHDVPYDTYAAWPAATREILRLAHYVTPKHAKAAIEGRLPDNDTVDRKFGRAEHCRLLEPSFFRRRFKVASPCSGCLQTGTRRGQPCGLAGRFFTEKDGLWFCGKHKPPDAIEPIEYISQEQAARIERVKEAVFEHAIVQMLRQHGGCEVSLIWERDGLPCKARLDKLIRAEECPTTILDLKKIQPCKGTEDDLVAAIRKYRYDFQAAWYVDGATRLLGESPLFAWIFTEDDEPFDVAPIWASDRMLEVGRCKVEAAWRTYLHCVRTNTWPGYCDEIREVDPAAWEMKRYGVN